MSRQLPVAGPLARQLVQLLLLGLLAPGLHAGPCTGDSLASAMSRQVPLKVRVHPAPPAITELARQRNLTNGIVTEPRPAAVDHPAAEALHRMLAELPERLRVLAKDHVAAIYLLEASFGSARALAMRDARGRLIGGCILLNLDALDRTANAWASWRDGSAFRRDDRYGIRLTLESPETDSLDNAVRFVFLHELGHIVGMAAGVHGYWAAPETWPVTARSPFTHLSWSIQGGGWLSSWKRPDRVLAYPRFYRFDEAPLPTSLAPTVYRALGATNWPSLYGSIDPYEDFAETFAIYVHTRLLLRPYRVDLYLDSEHVGGYRSCLDTGRCPRKLAMMERLLSNLPLEPVVSEQR